jgi:hypothetical protein
MVGMVLGACILLIQGCNTGGLPTKGTIATRSLEDDAARALLNSPTYRELSSINPRIKSMVDYFDRSRTILAIVEDVRTHITRAATLRVDSDGSISRQTYDAVGEEIWVYEYQVSR